MSNKANHRTEAKLNIQNQKNKGHVTYSTYLKTNKKKMWE